MISTHSTRTFNQDIRSLASLPRSLEQIVHPSPELIENLSRIVEILHQATDLLNAFLQERNCKCAVFNTNTHKFRRITANITKFNIMLEKFGKRISGL